MYNGEKFSRFNFSEYCFNLRDYLPIKKKLTYVVFPSDKFRCCIIGVMLFTALVASHRYIMKVVLFTALIASHLDEGSLFSLSRIITSMNEKVWKWTVILLMK